MRFVMLDTEGGVTALKVGGASIGGTISGATGFRVGQNCTLETSVLEKSSTDPGNPIKGTLTANAVSACDIHLAPGAQLSASSSVSGCTLTVTGGQVLAGTVSDTGVEALDSGIIANAIAGAGIWDLTNCSLSPPVGGTLVASGLSGEWGVTGGQIALTQMSASGLGALDLHLDGAAALAVAEVRFDEGGSQPVRQPFPDGPAHRLVYGDGANAIACGTAVPGGAFYVGTSSTIAKASGARHPGLSLDLLSSLRIATSGNSWSAWDSSTVDITLEPVPCGTQSIELVSPDLGAAPTPAVYVDVPAHGRFGTLTLPSGQGAIVSTADEYDNHADPPSGPDAENGVFRTVVVGARRVLRFATDGVIWYYGTAPQIDGTVQDKYGNTVPPEHYYSYFKSIRVTYAGDWRADCRISNLEVAMLQQAIAGGPSHYVAYMDTNSDGVLDNLDLAKVLANYATQPGCPDGEFLMEDGGMELAGVASAAGPDDGAEGADAVAELAAFMIAQLPPEDLAAFVAQASATAAAHEGDAIGADMVELLSYLPQ